MPKKIMQSTEVATEVEKVQVFDTETPALTDTTPRRFDLSDLPRYADKLYPILKKIFPHINDRMYGGWLRGCIVDNACHFVTIEGGVAMAQVINDPLDPRPVVSVTFNLGTKAHWLILYQEMVRWGKDIGAKEIRIRDADIEVLAKIKGIVGEPEERITHVLYLTE